MKVYFKNMLTGYSGKLDDAVMYYHEKADACILRSLPEFVPNERTEKMKNIMANLQAINPSEAYKQDFKDYLLLYNELKQKGMRKAVTWSNLYLKMLYNLQKTNPQVELLTLSRAQILAENLPCGTVKAAIEAGLLPEVVDYERFNNSI
jgi:hypothetical protein